MLSSLYHSPWSRTHVDYVLLYIFACSLLNIHRSTKVSNYAISLLLYHGDNWDVEDGTKDQDSASLQDNFLLFSQGLVLPLMSKEEWPEFRSDKTMLEADISKGEKEKLVKIPDVQLYEVSRCKQRTPEGFHNAYCILFSPQTTCKISFS